MLSKMISIGIDFWDRSSGVGGGPSNDLELREDGNNELREDGTEELRDA